MIHNSYIEKLNFVLVSVSGLNKGDKMILKKKVEAHGGIYLPELHMDTTDLLVCISDDSKFDNR